MPRRPVRGLVVACAAVVLLAGCAAAVRWDAPAGGMEGKHHTVMRGDTLYSIAFRHQLDYRKLARWNDIGGGYVIHPGQRLQLFAPASAARTASSRPAPSSPTGRAPATQPSASPSKPSSSSRPGRSQPAPSVVVGDPVASGDWRWPAKGSVVRKFSERSKGINIAGAVGDAITATADGTVVYAGSALKGYGLLVIVKHSETQLSAYGHNRRILVKEGQRVAAGERLAEMGLGPQRKALVHFEIRINGKPVDPLTKLPRTG